MSAYTDLLQELEAIRERRRRREEQNTRDWLEQVAQIVRSASDELKADLDAYDARKARQATEADLDRLERSRDMAAECKSWEHGE